MRPNESAGWMDEVVKEEEEKVCSESAAHREGEGRIRQREGREREREAAMV